MTPTIKVHLSVTEYRRLVAIAGRRDKTPDAEVQDLVAQYIAADQAGTINPVRRQLEPAVRPPTVRRCQYCDRPLPLAATVRRMYCNTICRVAANRRKKRVRVNRQDSL